MIVENIKPSLDRLYKGEIKALNLNDCGLLEKVITAEFKVTKMEEIDKYGYPYARLYCDKFYGGYIDTNDWEEVPNDPVLIFLEDEDQARAEEAQEAYADDWRGFWDYERDYQ